MKLHAKRQRTMNARGDVRPIVSEKNLATKVLLAIDGSADSQAVVTQINRRPWPDQSEIRLITVLPPIEANALVGSSQAVLDELIKAQRAEAVRKLDTAVEVFNQNSPGLLVTHVVRTGFPKDVILDEAQRWGADLVVVGSHGKSALLRLLLGSVSSAIATDAPCSVEIVCSS